MHDLDCYLKDDSHAWILQSDGSYKQIKPVGDEPYQAQMALLEEMTV